MTSTWQSMSERIEQEMQPGNRVEKAICTVTGWGLLLHGFRQLRWRDLLGMGLGVTLLRMAHGRAEPQTAAETTPTAGERPAGRQQAGVPQYSGGAEQPAADEVEEASMESFPASDPPAYTRTSI